MIPVENLKKTSHAPHVFVNMFFQILISYHVYTCRLRHISFLVNFTIVVGSVMSLSLYFAFVLC